MGTKSEIDDIHSLLGCASLLPEGFISFNEASALEQLVLTIVIQWRTIVSGVWLDMSNATQNITIRSKYPIDGINPRTFDVGVWTFGISNPGEYAGGGIFKRNITMTMQCGGAGAGIISIPYSVV